MQVQYAFLFLLVGKLRRKNDTIVNYCIHEYNMEKEHYFQAFDEGRCVDIRKSVCYTLYISVKLCVNC